MKRLLFSHVQPCLSNVIENCIYSIPQTFTFVKLYICKLKTPDVYTSDVQVNTRIIKGSKNENTPYDYYIINIDNCQALIHACFKIQILTHAER